MRYLVKYTEDLGETIKEMVVVANDFTDACLKCTFLIAMGGFVIEAREVVVI